MSFFDHWITKENAYILEVFFVLVFAILADIIQRKIFRGLSEKATKTKTKWDDAILQSIPKPLSIIIWIASIAFAADIIREALNAKILEAFYPIRNATIITALGYFLTLAIGRIEKTFLSDGKGMVDPTTLDALSKLARISVFITAALMILQTLGFSISGVLAFGGIGGVAIGFASKDLLSNFFGGFIIYMDRPFAVGDWVRSPDREIEGTVENIGWRVTRIRTFDKRPLYIPNSVFSHISVENPSRMSNRRIKETIGIRYDDAAKIESIINQVKKMLQTHPDIDAEKTLIVNFNFFALSSLDFFIYTFTKTTDWIEYHEVKQDVLLKIIKIVEGNGAEFAFPTSTMHLAHQEIFKTSESSNH
jgi:MscS family membrane protein